VTLHKSTQVAAWPQVEQRQGAFGADSRGCSRLVRDGVNGLLRTSRRELKVLRVEWGGRLAAAD